MNPQDAARIEADLNDPYPLELLDAITRLAQAIEANTAALRSQPAGPNAGIRAMGQTLSGQVAALAPLPPVAVQPVPADGCPIHNAPWKTVPAGVSKKTGKPYDAFRACSIAGCDQRPRL